MPDIEVRLADLAQQQDRRAVVEMTQVYATDAQGGGRPLDPDVADALAEFLASHPAALIFLAFEGRRPVGIATCALSFSTFRARPILNIHDLAVRPEAQGRGVASLLLDAVRAEAGRRGCCRLSLEVGGTNERARDIYAAWGFRGAREDDEARVKYFCELDL